MYYKQYTAVTWFVVPSYVLTIVLGTFGNIVVLRSSFSGELVRDKPYDLILSNGVMADLIICVIFTPLLLLYRANEAAHWIENSPLCEMTVFTSLLSVSLQYLVFPLFSLNRKDLVVNALSPWLSQRGCKKLLFVGWLFCSAVSAGQVAILRNISDSDDTPKLYRCIMVNREWDMYSTYFLGYCSLLYTASIVISMHCYARIHRMVSAADAIDSVLSVDDAKRTKMCKIVAIVYTLFWSPFLFVQLYGVFGQYSELVFNCHALASAIGVMASAVNPYLYSYMDHYYKKKFINIFKLTSCED